MVLDWMAAWDETAPASSARESKMVFIGPSN
jgi:hypothetical protein